MVGNRSWSLACVDRLQAGSYDFGMPVCGRCGEDNPERARFCLACGDPLPWPTARPGGSRRAVTVVFSDLSGSTTLGDG